MKVKAVLLFLILQVLLISDVPAQKMAVPADVQYPLLLKILSLDRQMDTRSQELVWGVVYQPNVRESWQAKNAFVKASEQTQARIKNRSVQLLPLELTDMNRLREAVERHQVDVLYIGPLRAIDIGTIAEMSRTLRVRTVTGVPDYVVEGLGVGIGLKGGKPRILMNLKATQAEGAHFNPQILRLAEVVKE